MIEKRIERLKEVGKLEISVHEGRCNGKTLAIGYKKGIENAIEIVQKAAGEYNNGWIPVEERLPVIEDEPIGIASDVGRKFMVTDCNGWVYDATFWKYANRFECDGIIAWQPFPEAYKEGEQP